MENRVLQSIFEDRMIFIQRQDKLEAFRIHARQDSPTIIIICTEEEHVKPSWILVLYVEELYSIAL